MQLLLKFDIDTNKEDISADFWNAHSGNWKDKENPTDLELKNSIKNEIDSWLEDLEIDFEMKDLTDEHEKAKAFNALVEGMKTLKWDKNNGTV